MSTATSLYLEILRFLAAMAVFLLHITFQGMTGGYLWQLGKFGNDAVMAFFVLSGFVIAFTAEHKHTSFIDYMVARFARLWSVVLPAITITFVLDTTAGLINPAAKLPVWTEFTFESVFASALFVNQIWFVKMVPGTNAPFWSISYEFFYYVIFAFAFYFKGTARVALLVLAAAVAGPKIMLCLPVWLLGVLAYKITKIELKPAMGWTLWITSIIAFSYYYSSDIKNVLEVAAPRGELLDNGTFTSAEIVVKYLFSLIVFVNIVGFNVISSNFASILNKNKNLIKGAARYSFSLYLYHFPFLMFFKVVHADSIGQWWQIAVMYIGTLGGVYLLALHTEHRKEDIAIFLNKILDNLAQRKGSALAKK